LLIAAFFLKILALLDQRIEKTQTSSRAHILTIEHITKPTPAPAVHARPAPRRFQPKPQVVPSPRPQPTLIHELTTNRLVASAPHVEQRSVLAPSKPGHPQLSAQQLARIERSMAAAIADDKAGIDPVKVSPEPIATPKRFAPDFTAFDGAIARGHGLCDPTTSWKDDGWDYYYVSCNVHLPDGEVQRQAVPWPIRWRPSEDPYNEGSHVREQPLPPPLPGWHLQPGQTVSDQLREYAREKGVIIT
jgi:hypothetical protein